MTRTLVITQADSNYYTVFSGTHICDKMGFDEALGVVSRWIIAPEKPLPYSTLVESYWEMERRIRKEIEDKLRPVDRLLLKEKAGQ